MKKTGRKVLVFICCIAFGAVLCACGLSKPKDNTENTEPKTEAPTETQTEAKKDFAQELLDVLKNETYTSTYEALKKGETVSAGAESETVSGLKQTLVDFGLTLDVDNKADDVLFDKLNSVLIFFGMDEVDKVDADVYTDLLSCLLVYKDEPSASKLQELYEEDGKTGRYDYMKGAALFLDGYYYQAQEAFEESGYENYEERAAACLQEFPETGEMWHNENLVSDAMYLTFTVESVDDEAEGMYILVNTADDEPASTLFIRGKDTVTVHLPGGNYRIQDASGKVWYGTQDCFGRDGHYERMVFEEIEGDDYLTVLDEGYEWTITINTSSGEGSGVGSEDEDWGSWNTGK